MEECPICLDDFYSLVVLTTCQHKYCINCLPKLGGKCSLCRRCFILREDLTWDRKTIARGMKRSDENTFKLILSLRRYDVQDVFGLFLEKVNIQKIWSPKFIVSILCQFRQFPIVTTSIVLALQYNTITNRISHNDTHNSNMSRHKMFDFLKPKVTGKYKLGIHLVKTLIYGDDDVVMNAIQYAVYVKRDLEKETLEHISKQFNQRLVLTAAYSLDNCVDQRNFHKEFDVVFEKYKFWELCKIMLNDNWLLDRELERAYDCVKSRGSAGVNIVYIRTGLSIENNVDEIIRLLCEKKNCVIRGDKIYWE
jgi:hypothetical protein